MGEEVEEALDWQEGQASEMTHPSSQRWSKVSESMSSSNGASLRSSISIRAADIFDRSLAWLDEELLSRSPMQSSSGPDPGHSGAVSASVGVKALTHFSKGKKMAKGLGGYGGGSRANGAGGRDDAGGSDRHRHLNGEGANGSYTRFPGPSEASLKGGTFEEWEYQREKNGTREH